MRVSRWKRLAWNCIIALFMPAILVAALLPRGRRNLLIWGPEPGIGNKYWSAAMKEAGHRSMTLMSDRYAINRAEDFDKYYVDFAKLPLPRALRWAIGSCVALIYALRNASVVHISYWGFTIGLSGWWRAESWLLQRAGVRTVIIGFGGDIYLYSTLADPSLRYGLLASYPHLAREEDRSAERIRYWNKRADVVLVGYMVDGIGRWDVTTNSVYMIDTRAWARKTSYSDADGRKGTVRVLHAPNHRGFKGTEFIIDAVDKLKAEGLAVELVLAERVPNDQMNALMHSVDILIDQCIMTGYALNSMEGMASGLPVMANLEVDFYTQVFRRYGFLDECPIVSVSPETLVERLRVLVERPELRRELGEASRAYAEKYHSFAMAQYLFGSIYDKIVDGADVDLLNLFHPLKSDYGKRTPKVVHPLVNNQLPTGGTPSKRDRA